MTDADQDWADASVLLSGEVFRFYNGMLLTIADNFPLPDEDSFQWKVDHFFSWYNKYYLPVFKQFHKSKVEILLPWLGEKVNVPIEPVLPPVMERLAGYEDKLENGVSVAQVDTFRGLIRELAVEVNGVLAEEERIIPGLLRQSAYNKEDMDEILKQISDARGLSGNMVLLPAIMFAAAAWAGNQIDEILSQEQWPSEMQTMLDEFWAPQWELESLRVLYAIAKQEEEPSVGCCFNSCVCACQADLQGCSAATALPGVCCLAGYRKCTNLTCCSDLAWSCGLW